MERHLFEEMLVQLHDIVERKPLIFRICHSELISPPLLSRAQIPMLLLILII